MPFHSNKEKGTGNGTRKGDGKPSTREKRTLDYARLHKREAVFAIDANKGQGKGGTILAEVLGSARFG